VRLIRVKTKRGNLPQSVTNDVYPVDNKYNHSIVANFGIDWFSAPVSDKGAENQSNPGNVRNNWFGS